MLAPFDIGLDISHFRAFARELLTDPWQGSAPVGDGWTVISEFGIFGALAGQMIRSGKPFLRISRNQSIVAIFLLPLVMEAAQSLFESHGPGLRSCLMETAGLAAGFLAGMRFRCFVRPGIGLLLLSAALVASGLSPYYFAGPQARHGFQWIPLVEYYSKTSASSLADAMFTFAHFALLGGLIFLSLRFPRYAVVFLAAILAFVIELSQTFIATRYAGTTDILLAALGAWTGDTICRNLKNAVSETPGPLLFEIRKIV
jgi:VanZ family protein